MSRVSRWRPGRPRKFRRIRSVSARASRENPRPWQFRHTSRTIFSLGRRLAFWLCRTRTLPPLLLVGFARQVAGRTRNPTARGGPAVTFRLPQAEVGRLLVGPAVGVVVTTQAGFHGGAARVELVRAVAGGAAQFLVAGGRLHRLPGHPRRHRRQALRQAHAVLAGQKALDLLGVAGLAGRVPRLVLPARGLRVRVLALVAGGAVDAGPGVGCALPLVRQPRL